MIIDPGEFITLCLTMCLQQAREKLDTKSDKATVVLWIYIRVVAGEK